MAARYERVARYVVEGERFINAGPAIFVQEASRRGEPEGTLIVTSLKVIFDDDRRGVRMMAARSRIVHAHAKRIMLERMRELDLTLLRDDGLRDHVSFYVARIFCRDLQRELEASPGA